MATKHFYYDQDKVKELRMMVINLTLDVLNDKPSVKKWSAYKRELVSKIAPRVLPVLHAGRDDDERLFPDPLLGGKTKNDVSSNHRAVQIVGDAEKNQGC